MKIILLFFKKKIQRNIAVSEFIKILISKLEILLKIESINLLPNKCNDKIMSVILHWPMFIETITK